ncbi:MAG: hypothetical protein KUG53_02965 [Pseudomonadales bacterium]|nr:hypothetical protein [Pseudomonadales bacterium]
MELLKDRYTRAYIEHLGNVVRQHCPLFNYDQFLLMVFDAGWNHRQLKARMHHIAVCFNKNIPFGYQQSIELLKKIAPQFGGFEAMFFPDFVETYGMEHWDESIATLEYFTQFSSSEFSVRPFIVQDAEKMMAQMLEWSLHENEHVRRLASEGCRPRLPWAMALPEFKKSPAPILPILENLKQDSSLYVRRSVANNLNDISKDNPRITINIAERWIGVHPDTDWLIKHASRTLLKKGEPDVLVLFGFTSQHSKVDNIDLSSSKILIGDVLEFCFELNCKSGSLGKTRVEYAIDFVKSNGKQTRKVFKISEGIISGTSRFFTKKHSFKPLSTRIHYAGQHQLAVIVNGVEKNFVVFDLIDIDT